MRVFKPNQSTKNGAVKPLYRMKGEGLGKTDTEEFYEKTNAKTPLSTLTPHNLKGLESIKIKTSRPKKFISLNI
jgi:hypothetical protein